MTLLVCGLLLFTVVHLVPSLAPGLKTAWLGRLGENGYKGTFLSLIHISEPTRLRLKSRMPSSA